MAITLQRLHEVVRYDPLTGLFTWTNDPSSKYRRKGGICGSVDKIGYRRIAIEGKRYLAHRLAWFYVTGLWPARDIDHRNLNKDDNAFCNLREATDSQNHANSPLSKRSSSGLKGANFNRFYNRWQSYIKVDGKSIFLGRFDTKEAAHAAYVAASARYHGEFGRSG
jgi:hypothetical protein